MVVNHENRKIIKKHCEDVNITRRSKRAKLRDEPTFDREPFSSSNRGALLLPGVASVSL